MRWTGEWLFQIAEQSSTALLVDIAVKATALVLLAMLFLRLLPRSSAALRHWVWCLTFCGLIVLPALCYIVPGWAIPVLPAWYQHSLPTATANDTVTPSNEATVVAASVMRPADRGLINHTTEAAADMLATKAATDSLPEDRRIAAEPVMPVEELIQTPSANARQTSDASRISAIVVPLAIWLGGAAVSLLPFVAGIVRSAVLRARARNIQDASWIALCHQTCNRLGLARAVQLLQVDAPIIPLSCGIVRPAVVLPSDACRWNEPLRRFVLLHELAHIKRHDVVFQLIARFACVVYWFHPLVWYAMHRLRVERELACDDTVLAAGERASDYAEQLLEVARRLTPVRLHAAVAMAQSNKLEYRIDTLFSRARSHLPLGTRASRLLLACAAVLVIAVSVVRPMARATGDDQPAEEQQRANAAEPAQQVESAKPRKIAGRVVAADGQPVEGARVVVVRVKSELNTRARSTELVTETLTDGKGRFTAHYPAEPPRSDFYLYATAPGHGLTWDYAQSARAGKECLLKLAPDDAPIEGRVLDLEGQPIAGVQVAVRSISASAENIDEWINKARDNPAEPPSIEERYSFYYRPRKRPIATFPVQESLELDHPRLTSATTTDANGRFRLTGLGSKRLVRLEVSGAGVAKAWINAVTYSMESVPYPQVDPRYRFAKCFGSRFDVALEPEQRINGVVRDAATAQPLAGVEVRLRQFANFGFDHERFIFDVSDANGHYDLRGIPRPSDAGGGLKLRLIPSDDQPYFRTDVDVPRGAALDAITHDVELKRGVWIRGRVVDDQSGEPITGEVAYYPFLANEAAKDYANFDPRVRGIGDDYHYATADDGSFRIPGLPGRGLLTFLADEDGHYPRADGADAIGGLRPKSTADRAVVYYFYTADLVNAVREINAPAGAEEFTCEVKLKPFTAHKVRLLDPEGKPLTGVVVEGLTRIPIRGRTFERVPQPSAIVEIFGLAEDQPRDVKFAHRDRGLANIARLSVDDFRADKPKDITLLSAGVITGRLVDEQGKPVSGAYAFASLDVDGEDEGSGFVGRWKHSIGNTVKSDGRLVIENLPPSVEYSLRAYHSATDRGATLEVGPLKPGERLDIGDITLRPPKPEADAPSPQPRPISFADRFPTKAKSSKAKDQDIQNKQMPKPADNGEKASPRSTVAQPTASNDRTTVRGRVVGTDGRPAHGANVAVIARRATTERGAELAPDGVVLAEATADEQGRYQLSITGASSKTHRDAHIVARANNTGLAWRKLDLDAAEVEASFELKPAEVLAGRLVDLEGQPAAAVELKTSAIRPSVVENQLLPGGIDFWRSAAVPAAWPQPIISDKQGRFSISGVPAGHGVLLTVEGSDRFAPQEIALNTGMPEQRGERDATYRPQVVKNARPGEEIVVPLAPAQIFTGRVTYDDSGEPAPYARVTIWASQQEYGSMIALAGRADAEGRYRINPYPGNYFGVRAYAPSGAPYLTRRVDNIAWDSGSREKEVNLKLPRGAIVRGEVLEEGSGKPVADATVQYVPEEVNNPNVRDDFLTGWQAIETTDEKGRFQIVVLPGPGRLLVHGPEDKYVLRETSSDELYYGRPGGKRYYMHGIAQIDPAKDSEPPTLTIRLQRGGAARGELVDEQGRSIDEALMVTRLHVRPYWLQWRGDPREVLGGRFELGGLAPNQEYPVHFLDPKRRLGATVMLKAGTEPTRVVLEPCGEAAMRFVDEDGKPIADHRPGTRLVVTPGPLDWNRDVSDSDLSADEDFVSNIDRLNHGTLKADAEGRVTLPALIPGATYRVLTVRSEKLVIAKEFQAKSGETIDLGDIVYERVEK